MIDLETAYDANEILHKKYDKFKEALNSITPETKKQVIDCIM